MIVRISEKGFDFAWESLMKSDHLCPPFFSKAGVALEIESNRHRGLKFVDRSFVVLQKGIPEMGMRIAAFDFSDGPPELSAYGHPVTLTRNWSLKMSSQTVTEVEKEIERIFLEFPERNFLYRESLASGELTPIGHRLLASGAQITPRFTRVIDLTQSIDALCAARRRRFKNLIAWGEKNLSIEFMTSENVDPDIFERCRQLHISESGRETRSRESWDRQLDRVRSGEAYVSLARMAGEIVSFGYFTHTRSLALYYSSASRRDLFEKPIFHAPLWKSILRAKEIGCRWFEVGGLLFTGVGGSLKKDRISHYKSGFGGTSRAHCNFSLKTPPVALNTTTELLHQNE